jgi:tripartite-type tricarboxylate transporter receptor subunit TctC
VLPDVPTLAELGYRDMTRTAWLGLWIHPDAPATLQQRLRDEVLKTLPAVRDRVAPFGLPVNTTNPPTSEQMWTQLAADHRSIGEMLKAVNYKPE